DKHLHDAPVFRILAVHGSEKSTCLTVGPGRYFQYYGSCEFLDYELRSALYRLSRDNTREDGQARVISLDLLRRDLPKRCPIRQQAMALLRTSASEWFGYACAAAGLNLLTVLVDPASTDQQFLRHLRGRRVAEAEQTYHVVPAGTFQPPRTDTA